MPGSGTSTLNVPAGSELVAEVEPYADAGFWVKRPVDGDGRLGGVLLYRVNPNNKPVSILNLALVMDTNSHEHLLAFVD